MVIDKNRTSVGRWEKIRWRLCYVLKILIVIQTSTKKDLNRKCGTVSRRKIHIFSDKTSRPSHRQCSPKTHPLCRWVLIIYCPILKYPPNKLLACLHYRRNEARLYLCAQIQREAIMRFNKQELITLATQPSTKFEKEGVLYIRERQEGFFRKSESE